MAFVFLLCTSCRAFRSAACQVPPPCSLPGPTVCTYEIQNLPGGGKHCEIVKDHYRFRDANFEQQVFGTKY